ncbi:response regulator, partial [Candidatus Roizmanbacteria bacterium]|nr:response regulator [Candidatus Roizmanbacteria bacterium]
MDNRSKIVVIIEDEEAVQNVYKTLLRKEEYTVYTEKTAQAGLDTIKYVKPNLVLLDIMLPGGMNGFDLLEQLKKDPDTKYIPVIVLTNLDSEKDTALEIGAVDYLV